MSEIMTTGKFRIVDSNRATFYCPGCKDTHTIIIDGPSAWSYNHNVLSPTVSPSILVTTPMKDTMIICHSFVTDGMIKYLDDCTHGLAGQTVELPQYESMVY